MTGELPPYLNDVWEVARAFAPFLRITEDGIPLHVEIAESETLFSCRFFLDGEEIAHGENAVAGDRLYDKKINKRTAKTVLYRALCGKTGITLPYGSLTGVRPTKLFYELNQDGKGEEKLMNDFFVEPSRTRLIADVAAGQKDVYEVSEDNVDIFVNVPFCPTRCKYCSFISVEIAKVKKEIPRYIACVRQELEGILEEISREGKRLTSIYVGGGTPTSLEAEELCEMLSPLKDPKVEFTVESGRADSITREKLEAMAGLGVTRISVNPQTFSDETLQRIGRSHTASDVLNAYRMAREFPFAINMDLIAGLEGETHEDFLSSVRTAVSLQPENLTMHTLSLKRGAVYRTLGAEKQADGKIKEMVDRSREMLYDADYRPYYMYRQKNMADNLENVGYTLKGYACKYNVDYMEETNTVLSAGAGAMTKRVYPKENRLERKANGKGLHDYFRAFSDSNPDSNS